MRTSLKSVLAAGLLVCVLSASASAAITITSVVDQSGFAGPQVGGGASYPLATFDYTNPLLLAQGSPTDYLNLTSIDTITLTATINDGDSDVAEFAFNNMTLVLDNINTGLVLNGFTNNLIVTLSLSNNPALAAQILAALQSDGLLVATVLDNSANPPIGDNISFPALAQASLQLDGQGNAGPAPIPLPAAVLLAPLGAGLAGLYARRFRRA